MPSTHNLPIAMARENQRDPCYRLILMVMKMIFDLIVYNKNDFGNFFDNFGYGHFLVPAAQLAMSIEYAGCISAEG